MLPWSGSLAGRVEEQEITSELLRGNPLGDPYVRPLWVYLPPGYDDDPGRRFPSVYVIQGYTGHLTMWANRMPYRQPFPETADAMFAAGEAPGAVVVYVDAWTAYGGSQFVDSPGTGRYHSYLCDEVVSYVDANYRTLPAAEHRAIMGKSSGGFGAMITPMLRPDLFGALATHSGDTLYELSYVPEFGKAVRHLRQYDGDIFRWWADFRSRPSFTKEGDHALLEVLGVSACFSAREDGEVELPFDPRTGVIRPQVWQRWLDWDPVRMVPRYAAELRALRGIWIDAGTRDECFLDVGAEAFLAALRESGVADEVIRFELFEGDPRGRGLPVPAVAGLALPAHRRVSRRRFRFGLPFAPDRAPQGGPLGGDRSRGLAPFLDPHQARFHQVGAVEEPRYLLAASVGDLVLNHPVGDAHETVVLAGVEKIRAGVRDGEVAAGRDGGKQRGDDVVRLVGVGDRVQQREQGDRDRLGEVEELAGLVEDLLGVAHVGVDVLGGA